MNISLPGPWWAWAIVVVLLIIFVLNAIGIIKIHGTAGF